MAPPLGRHRQSLGVPRMRSGAPETTSQGGKPPTTLKLWILRFQSGGVVLEGYKTVSDNDLTTLQNWRSTPIAVRIDSKTLQTHSGSIYKLKGGIDEDEAAEAGIPEELIEQFSNGFPENWEELIQQHLQEQEEARRRESINTATTMDTERDEEEERGAKGMKSAVLQFEETMDMGDTSEDEGRLKDARKRRSMQKGRQSMMHRVQPRTPIEEEEEEEEETPARKKTPARKSKVSETPITRHEDKKTPRGRSRGTTTQEEEEDMPAPSTSRGGITPRATKMTPKGRERIEEEEDEVFATPDEVPRVQARNLAVVAIPETRRFQRKEETTPTYPSFGQGGRVSLDAIPREVMEKSVPLTRWVIKFVRGGTDKSIFPHFQFKIQGFRPECDENEWNTTVIQKVVPPYIMFTTSSIYRLDGQLDVDQATSMGFPPIFIQDFLLGFPDDWDERLELFFNKTFGPPPKPKIVEVMSDGGDDAKIGEKKRGENSATLLNRERPTNRANGNNFDYDDFESPVNRKRKEPTPSSASSNADSSDEEEELRREARKVEKEMRREEIRAQKEAELRAKAKEEKKKRFEVKINTTPDGVTISRSGRTLRKPMAQWAGEGITYDVHGNVVDITGVTTTTKLTVGKTNEKQAEQLAAHFGLDSPLNSTTQKERSIAPPAASLPKTPAPKKSKADYKGYSDDETGAMNYEEYLKMKALEDMATPAYILKKGKRRCRAVESSDSEAEAEARRKEEKRKKKEERRRLKESEEEDESSDDGWRRKKKSSKSKKKVTVKKEKQVKRAPSKKTKKSMSEDEEEEEGMGSGLEIEHDEDAVTFVLSDAGSNIGRGNGYSDNEEIQSEQERAVNKRKSQKKQPVNRKKEWKKEEVTRLKLAIQAANPSGTPDGWEVVAKSLGGGRTAEECKKIAMERLKMTFPEEESDGGEYGSDRGWSGESGAWSEDEEKKNRRKGRLDDDGRIKGITAKPGTIAFAQEMEMMKRERLMGGAPHSQDDFMKNSKARMSGVHALPSVAVFDPDDSLLEILGDDDAPPAPKQRTTKTAMMAAAAATPRLAELSSYEDSPGSGGSARRSSAKFIPSPVVNQNDLTRYVHQLSRTKNMSMMSKSAIDQSRMMPPPPPRGRIAARAAEAISRGVNKVDKLRNGRRRDQMDDLDEDDENNDEILAGI